MDSPAWNKSNTTSAIKSSISFSSAVPCNRFMPISLDLSRMTVQSLRYRSNVAGAMEASRSA
eukprot:600438-Amphidinium_carterae.2